MHRFFLASIANNLRAEIDVFTFVGIRKMQNPHSRYETRRFKEIKRV